MTSSILPLGVVERQLSDRRRAPDANRRGRSCLSLAACAETPTQPRNTTSPLADGPATADASVAADGCDLASFCSLITSAAGRSCRRHVRGQRHLSHRGWADQHQPGAPRDVFRRLEGADADAQRDAQRSVAATGILRAAADKRYRQVRGAVRVNGLILGSLWNCARRGPAARPCVARPPRAPSFAHFASALQVLA
jgi:hypothetical protein